MSPKKNGPKFKEGDLVRGIESGEVWKVRGLASKMYGFDEPHYMLMLPSDNPEAPNVKEMLAESEIEAAK